MNIFSVVWTMQGILSRYQLSMLPKPTWTPIQTCFLHQVSLTPDHFQT